MLKKMAIVFIAGLILGLAPKFLSANPGAINIGSATVTPSVSNH